MSGVLQSILVPSISLQIYIGILNQFMEYVNTVRLTTLPASKNARQSCKLLLDFTLNFFKTFPF